MTTITGLRALQVFDSRGNPTIEAEVMLSGGVRGSGLVPSGASTGHHEALELRDGDPRRFRGRSVQGAIRHVEGEIATAVIGRDALDQASVDAALIALDGTPNKSRLGANAILATSLAVAAAAAKARRQPLFVHLGEGRGDLLPLPEIQIFGGGKHAGGRIDVQDFMVMAIGAQSYPEALEMTFNVYQSAGDLLRRRGRLAGVADEGGFWPEFNSNEDALTALVEAIEGAGYAPGRDIAISLDIAATDLFRDGGYVFGSEQRRFSPEAFTDLVTAWIEKYPIASVEDPCAEDDWESWRRIRQAVAHRCQLIGDDHFTTNLARIERGIAAQTANSVLIKLNQIGTVTETQAAIRRTQAAGWLPVVSARSGETEDAFIAHLAVAMNAGQLKVGSFTRGERMAKWNEVLRIERELGPRARFIGAAIFDDAGITLPFR